MTIGSSVLTKATSQVQWNLLASTWYDPYEVAIGVMACVFGAAKPFVSYKVKASYLTPTIVPHSERGTDLCHF